MDYLNDQLTDTAKIIKPNEGEMLSFGNSSIHLRLTSEDTKDQFGIYQITLEGGQKVQNYIIIGLWTRLLL